MKLYKLIFCQEILYLFWVHYHIHFTIQNDKFILIPEFITQYLHHKFN